MSPEALTAERAYRALKDDILRGRFTPGIALNVQLIAQEQEMSISPVRDALHRMVGERLLVARPGGGFEAMPISEDTAHDLYRWHAYLLNGAVSGGRSIRSGEDLLRSLERVGDADTEAIIALTSELFYRIGETADNIEHLLAIRAAGERLTILRWGETCFDDRKSELRRLTSSAISGGKPALRRAVAAYHRRRFRHLTVIVRDAIVRHNAI
jgi:DNA-binding GntR family transcriptional regulator